MGIRAVVRNRRLIVDEVVDLPDGTEVQLVIDEDADSRVDPDTAERVREAFDRIGEQAAVPAHDVVADLRALRGNDVSRCR